MIDFSAYGLVPIDQINSGISLRRAFVTAIDREKLIPPEVMFDYHDALLKAASRLKFPLQWVRQEIPGYDYPLSPWQMRKISDIVDNHVQSFMYETMGYDLPDRKITELKSLGVLSKNVSKMDFPSTIYAFGRAMAMVEQGINYQDAKRLATATPLTAIEQATIEHMRGRACQEVTGMGNDFAGKIMRVVIDKNRQWLQDMITSGISKKLTYQQIALEIGNATGDWGRDLFRIVYTEGHSYSQLAQAYALKNAFGYHPETGKPRKLKVVKVPEKDACKYCYQLYVENDGSLKVFDLDEMISGPLMNTPYTINGTEIRRRASLIGDKIYGWVATLGAAHPYCRCRIALWYPHLYSRDYIVEKIAAGKLPGEAIKPINKWQAQYHEHMKPKPRKSKK